MEHQFEIFIIRIIACIIHDTLILGYLKCHLLKIMHTIDEQQRWPKFVVTLALGSRLRQGLPKVWAESEA